MRHTRRAATVLATAAILVTLALPHSPLAHSTLTGIDGTTWAPTGPGAYFFDRSNITGGSPTDYQSRESQFGRKFDGHLYYVPAATTAADLADAHWSLATDGVPFVTVSWATGNNPTSIIPDIVSGKYDSDINGFAGAVKSQLSPFGRTLIRPFWEFNYTGSEWNDTNYGGNASQFVAAWQHFVTLFRNDGVTNIKWLWNPIRIGGSQSQDPTAYYPGSSWVDWIGEDAYPKNSWMTMDQLATTSSGGSSFDWYDTYKSFGKPMMFGEIGIQPENAYAGGAQTRATWWADGLTELQTQLPAIRAVEYFDSTGATDWAYDSPGTASGDSGADALAAAAKFGSNCYMNTRAASCGGGPSQTPAPTPSPAPPTPTATGTPPPTATPTGTPAPTATPTATPAPTPTPGPTPTVTAQPSPTPIGTPTPTPTGGGPRVTDLEVSLNPLVTQTQIQFTLGSRATVSLVIKDGDGTVVNHKITDVTEPAGTVVTYWMGKNDAGAPVPDGRYTILVTATDSSGTTRASVPITVQR